MISTDISPEMVELSRQFAATRGLDNVEHQQLDAERMELETDSVDIVLCRSALMLLPDPGAALSESHRVLRPGGVLAFSVFTTAAENPWVAVPGRVFAERGLVSPPPPGAPGMFSLGDPARIRELVSVAGFAEPTIEKVGFEFDWADDDAAWSPIVEVNALLGPIVKAMSEDERANIRGAVLDSFAQYRKDDGSYRVPAGVWTVAARPHVCP